MIGQRFQINQMIINNFKNKLSTNQTLESNEKCQHDTVEIKLVVVGAHIQQNHREGRKAKQSQLNELGRQQRTHRHTRIHR